MRLNSKIILHLQLTTCATFCNNRRRHYGNLGGHTFNNSPKHKETMTSGRSRQLLVGRYANMAAEIYPTYSPGHTKSKQKSQNQCYTDYLQRKSSTHRKFFEKCNFFFILFLKIISAEVTLRFNFLNVETPFQDVEVGHDTNKMANGDLVIPTDLTGLNQ